MKHGLNTDRNENEKRRSGEKEITSSPLCPSAPSSVFNTCFIRGFPIRILLLAALLCAPLRLHAAAVFSTYSAYHYIEVLDEGGMRTLSFNGSQETRMYRDVPLQGHFEYTEYFHMPWLWNTNVKRVLMIGLGGGSTQRSFQHYYTNVFVDTVELDPAVVKVAKEFFQVKETPTHRIQTNDGRIFLRRSTNLYDLIIMDAYATTRYGSSVPAHLTTMEFFTLARNHLTTNGVLAYNIIGQMQGWNESFVASMYRTMHWVFPQVYLFPAEDSMNVVLIATRSAEHFDAARVQKQGAALMRDRVVTLPLFATRLKAFENVPPVGAARASVLTDARSGVERLLR
jgi:spermidine synthase